VPFGLGVWSFYLCVELATCVLTYSPQISQALQRFSSIHILNAYHPNQSIMNSRGSEFSSLDIDVFKELVDGGQVEGERGIGEVRSSCSETWSKLGGDFMTTLEVRKMFY